MAFHTSTRWSVKSFASIHQHPFLYVRYKLCYNFISRQEMTTTQAHVDNVLPLSRPTVTADVQVVDSLFVAKGTVVYVPITALNRSEILWGKTAKDFNPNRWLDDSISQEMASEIQGYRHMLTFSNGPRACLGRTFALTEIKVKRFMFSKPTEFSYIAGCAVCPDTKLRV
jgi:hypothetical protein